MSLGPAQKPTLSRVQRRTFGVRVCGAKPEEPLWGCGHGALWLPNCLKIMFALCGLSAPYFSNQSAFCGIGAACLLFALLTSRFLSAALLFFLFHFPPVRTV